VRSIKVNGFWQAVEGHGPELVKGDRVIGQRLDHGIGCENLARLGGCAQASRHVDRPPEIVAVLKDRRAGRDLGVGRRQAASGAWSTSSRVETTAAVMRVAPTTEWSGATANGD
jgi:hypothetical protein